MNGHYLHILGQADTDKTMLINKVGETMDRRGKKVAMTASTGIAASTLQPKGSIDDSWAELGDAQSYIIQRCWFDS